MPRTNGSSGMLIDEAPFFTSSTVLSKYAATVDELESTGFTGSFGGAENHEVDDDDDEEAAGTALAAGVDVEVEVEVEGVLPFPKLNEGIRPLALSIEDGALTSTGCFGSSLEPDPENHPMLEHLYSCERYRMGHSKRRRNRDSWVTERRIHEYNFS